MFAQGVCDSGSDFWTVLELCSGGRLESWLRRCPNTARTVILQLLEARFHAGLVMTFLTWWFKSCHESWVIMSPYHSTLNLYQDISSSSNVFATMVCWRPSPCQAVKYLCPGDKLWTFVCWNPLNCMSAYFCQSILVSHFGKRLDRPHWNQVAVIFGAAEAFEVGLPPGLKAGQCLVVWCRSRDANSEFQFPMSAKN